MYKRKISYHFIEEITDDSYKITCNYCGISQNYYSPDFVSRHKDCAVQQDVKLAIPMKLYFSELENGSIFIEWISDDARFCINIEKDISELGWCYVTKDFSHADSGEFPPELLNLLAKYVRC